MTRLAATEPDWDRIPLQRAPRQQRSREKVARALAAASDLVAREGVSALTLPRVAEAAGVSVGALYQYLPDRDAIVRALVAEYHARLEALLENAWIVSTYWIEYLHSRHGIVRVTRKHLNWGYNQMAALFEPYLVRSRDVRVAAGEQAG